MHVFSFVLSEEPFLSKLIKYFITLINIKGPFGKAPAPASLAPYPDPCEELILLILLENQNHF
jgi:hypothetical protein